MFSLNLLSVALLAGATVVDALKDTTLLQNQLDHAAESEALEMNDAPLIGVGAQPIRSSSLQEYKDMGYNYYIQAAYVQQLNAVGARVVPLIPNEDGDYSESDEMLPHLNGLLFTGGSGGSRYFVEHLLDKAKEINDAGETFPVMGICLGFQYMAIWASSASSLLDTITSKKVSLPLEFVGNPADTKMFGELGDIAYKYEEDDMLFQYHTYGINPDHFETNEGLKNMYKLTSIQYTDDEAHTPFVGSIEAHDYPFFGMQWHPEKVGFTFNDYGFNRSEESLLLNEYFFRNYIGYARQNDNKYGSNWSTQPIIIQNYDNVVTQGYWGQIYLFK